MPIFFFSILFFPSENNTKMARMVFVECCNVGSCVSWHDGLCVVLLEGLLEMTNLITSQCVVTLHHSTTDGQDLCYGNSN